MQLGLNMQGASSVKWIYSLLFIHTYLAALAQAVKYEWVFTYGEGNWICHAKIEVDLNNNAPHRNPSASVHWAYCVTADNDKGRVVTIPTTRSGRTNAYILVLDPSTSSGDVGFELGVDMPATGGVPGMNPRVNMYTLSNAVFLGHCSYRQGAIQLAQTDGSRDVPYTPLPTHNSCPSGSSIDRTQSIGRWLLCQISCAKF